VRCSGDGYASHGTRGCYRISHSTCM
jgi:hypothetical protein